MSETGINPTSSSEELFTTDDEIVVHRLVIGGQSSYYGSFTRSSATENGTRALVYMTEAWSTAEGAVVRARELRDADPAAPPSRA